MTNNFKIKEDFDLIVHKMPRELDEMHIYPLGDLHKDSEIFDIKLWENWKKVVFNDPLAYIVLVGDIFDNTLKNSKGNSYSNTGRTSESKRWFANELKPMKDRILAGVDGNHEYRSVHLSDNSPLEDVMCKLDVENVFRYNMAFIKISLGEKSKERQFTYTFVLAHGCSDSKSEKFQYAIDGMDVFITGHTHQPKITFPAKFVIDPYNNKVTKSGFTHITVPSFQYDGGYTIKNMYMPQDNSRVPYIILSGTNKYIETRWI